MGITKDFKDGLLWRVLSFFSLIFPVPRQKIRFSGLLSLEKSGADWGADSGRNPASTSYIMLNRSKHVAISTAARQSSFPSAVGIWSGTFRMDASNLPLPGKFWSFDFCQCIYLNVACGVACVCVCPWKTKFLEDTFVKEAQCRNLSGLLCCFNSCSVAETDLSLKVFLLSPVFDISTRSLCPSPRWWAPWRPVRTCEFFGQKVD